MQVLDARATSLPASSVTSHPTKPGALEWGPSVRPGRLALDPLAVERAALGHAVGPVLEAEEVQGRIGVISPGPCGCGADAQHGAFCHVDALAVHEELAPAP